jgi:uncharacterized membrane protein HdeD (DUF308 family)
MTKWQKLRNILLAASMILIGVAMLVFGEKTYMGIIGIFSLTLEIMGLRMLWFYFRMARHMVGGRNILFRGILFFDFGIFTGSLVWVPKGYILVYLAGTLAFSGVVNIIGASEAKRIESAWKFKTFQGVVKILFAIICLIFMRSEVRVVDICAIGFILSAVMSIANTFRRQQVITID